MKRSIMEGKIWVNTPYNTDKDLITAYNDFFELIGENDWAVFIDHDAMPLDPFWFHNVVDAIKKYPDYGFTCLSNRCGNIINQCHRKYGGDDIITHRQIALRVAKKNKGKISDWNHSTRELMNGHFIVLSKKMWRKMGKIQIWQPGYSKILGVDNSIQRSLLLIGSDIKVIDSIYVYHFYSGSNEIMNRNVSHLK